MLSPNLWKPWEPKAVFPLFGGTRTFVDFVAQEGLFCRSWKDIMRPAYYLWHKKKKLVEVVHNYLNILLDRPMRFRGIVLERSGRYVGEWQLGEIYSPGEFISMDINALAEKSGIQLGDGVLILLANRGRTDIWNSSPGSATVRYVGDSLVGGYRTGLFSRTLNPVHGKRHFGFTGLNPQVILNDRIVPSILLINHSVDPEYDRIVTPTIRLYRNPSEFVETIFGEIPPHGALERSILDLFSKADRFLEPTGGRGFTVTQAEGSSLASIHILRARDGRSLGMDHSRPAFTNIVDYMG